MVKYVDETGVVQSVENGKTKILLDHNPTEDCGGCCACSAFIGGLPVIEVSQDEFNEGERVRVHIPRSNPYLSIFLVFFVPLILLMAGVFIGHAFEGRPSLGAKAAIGGGIGLVLALCVAWLSNHLITPSETPTAEKL